MEAVAAEARTPSSTAKDWKEGRRLRALELKAAGWKQNRIAEALGVTESAVSQWLRKARGGGAQALLRRKAAGPVRRLSPELQERIPALLEKGAESFGFRGQVWTAARVAQIIRRELGVSYSERHARRLLREAGYSPQKPERRATQRDEAAIQAWREESWPAQKKGRFGSGAPSYS
jgi:transposase